MILYLYLLPEGKFSRLSPIFQDEIKFLWTVKNNNNSFFFWNLYHFASLSLVPTCGNLEKKSHRGEVGDSDSSLKRALGSWWLLSKRPSSKGELILDGVMKELVRNKGGFKIWGPMVFAKNRDRVCKCSLKVGGRFMTWLHGCKELRCVVFERSSLRIRLSNSSSSKAQPALNPSSSTTTPGKKKRKEK